MSIQDFFTFIWIACSYTIAGSSLSEKIFDLFQPARTNKMNPYDAVFIAFAPITVPASIIYFLILFIIDKDNFNEH